ncbi:hypothetical protein WI69_01920 [Burkholderia diffusa]|uniref:hypothetical protein n=1 Tax=Burkholderia diffusa TaxID=488732 RepID=UPI00076DB08E|nr:hypothetical protein [Burkholderia diffusa]KVC24212.1 hypothetical protein WI69_01920 [Burkholderia diffusa]
MSITTIEDRFVLLLKERLNDAASEIAGRGSWERLEQRSGISARRWRNAFDRRQRPTSDMIEMAGRMWPQYAFWLVTGITDATNGHVAPSSALTFPERLYADSPATETYFHQSLELAGEFAQGSGIDLGDEAQRMYAAERKKPFAHWISSDAADTAYQLAESSAYKNLEDAWRARELERDKRISKLMAPAEAKPDKRRAAAAKQNGLADPILGGDPRSAHQSTWDLFYKVRKDDESNST